MRANRRADCLLIQMAASAHEKLLENIRDNPEQNERFYQKMNAVQQRVSPWKRERWISMKGCTLAALLRNR